MLTPDINKDCRACYKPLRCLPPVIHYGTLIAQENSDRGEGEAKSPGGQRTAVLPSRLQLLLVAVHMWSDRYLPLSLLSSPDFNLFHMIAVGLSSSILGCLVTLLVYSYCQRYQQQSHDATVIHPISAAPLNTSITNHINKLDKYDSVEAIKVRGKVWGAWRPSILSVAFLTLKGDSKWRDLL